MALRQMHPTPQHHHTNSIGPSADSNPGCALRSTAVDAPAVTPCAAQNPSTQQLAVSTLRYSATVALGTTGKLCVGTYAGTGGSSSQRPNTTMPPAQHGHHQDTKYQAPVAEAGPRAPTTPGLWVDKDICISIDRNTDRHYTGATRNSSRTPKRADAQTQPTPVPLPHKQC